MKKLCVTCCAVMATACLLTACGPREESRSTAELTESSAETDVDSSSVDTTSTETTVITETTTTVAPESGSHRPYEEALEAYINTMSEGDYMALFAATYPNDLYDLLYEVGGELLEELPVAFDGIELQLVDYHENGVLDMEAMHAVGVLYTGIYQALDYVRMYPDVAELPEELLAAEGLESIYEISRGYDITVTIAADGETTEVDLMAFYMEGDGWKFLDNSLQGYVDASKQKMIQATAKSIYNAVNSVLIDMDVNGLNVVGNYIICSDSSLNQNVPADFDLATFENKLSQCFTAIAECEYIAVIQNGACCTVVCMQRAEPDYVGCYPVTRIVQISSDPDVESETLLLDESRSYTFEELYALCTAVLE